MYDPWTRTKEEGVPLGGGAGCAGPRGIKRRRKCDNYNSIINKIYLKTKNIKTKLDSKKEFFN